MPRPRRVTTADTLAPIPSDLAEETLTPPQPSPVAAVEPEPGSMQPGRTPARQRLADAIENAAALRAEIAEAGAAKAQAEDEQRAAWSAKTDAEADLQRARPREAEEYTPAHPPFRRVSQGGSGTWEEVERARLAAERPPLSIADAKAKLQTATDAYDSARRAVQHHQGRIDRASDRLRWSSSIDDAVRAVALADPALIALAAECRRLATRAEAARQAFALATNGAVMQRGSPCYGAGTPADARSDPEAMADWSVARDWRAALEALSSDPDAPLPMP